MSNANTIMKAIKLLDSYTILDVSLPMDYHRHEVKDFI